MDGDEGFEVAVALDEVHNIFHFDLRVGIGTVVGVGTGILAGSSTWEKMSIVKYEKPMIYYFNKRERYYLHTTKTSIPVPIGISATAGGAKVHRASFTPHTVLNAEAQMSLVMLLNTSLFLKVL